MNKINKFIAFLLCIMVLIASVNYSTKSINAAETTIDLTNLSTGENSSHTCIFKTNYDENNHWEECIICKKTKNIKEHTTKRSWAFGYSSCHQDNYATDICQECGYSKTYRVPCTWDGHSYVRYSSMMPYSHVKLCSVHNSVIYFDYYYNGTLYSNTGNSHTERCYYYENGEKKIATCRTSGKSCAVCGQTFTGLHNPYWVSGGYFSASDDNLTTFNKKLLTCVDCGEVFATTEETNTHWLSNGSWYTKFVSTVTFENGNTFVSASPGSSTDSSWFDNTNFSYNTSVVNGKNVMTMTTTRRIKTNSISSVYFDDYQQLSLRASDGNIYSFVTYSGRGERPEYSPPVVKSVDATTITSVAGWSTSVNISVTGTEDHASLVSYQLYDDNDELLNEGKASVNNNVYSFSFIPCLEADGEGRTFYFLISDEYGNSTKKTFTLSKIDSKAPTMFTEKEYTSEWSKTKNITFVVTDTGIGSVGKGAVYIGFNNQDDLREADYNNGTFSREYSFTGDVYDSCTGAIYIKDRLGNITTEFVKIGKLDNTNPTISNVKKVRDNNKMNFTVTANDINTKLNASGSGVVGYGISTTEKEPTSWQTSNILTVNKNGIYYIYAKDAVGNISSPKKVSVTELTAAYKVLHQQEQLNGTYTTVETENLSGTTGNSVTPAVKSYTGFTSPSTQTATISADGSTTVTYKYARKTYDLDVNVILDGTSYNTGVDGITFDAYVNGTKVGSGKDFCKRSAYKYGSTYEIKNISCPGYIFDTSSSIKGTITANMNVQPKFTTNSYTVTYKDVVDNTSGSLLGQSTLSKKYGSSVRGTDIGSSTADNAYYNGYYYVSDTSATVGTSGATVYRIFKLRTIDIVGSVVWTDNSNKWSTRPNEVTVSLYRDGLKVDSATGLTSSNSNNYSFNNVPKYSTSDGHVYNYTVSQSKAVSKTSPEDKYTTTQNTHNFTNVLGNTDKDAGNKGLTVKGSIYWEDKGDTLGYRPKTVTITLYQNGIEYKTLEVDSFNDNTYEFSKLPKYDSNLNKYSYTVKETVIANYLIDGEIKDAYTIKADTPNALDFTNVFNVPENTIPLIPVKPDHENTITVKTNTEDMITISLKGMETIINSDLSVSYGNNYNGQVYNLSANNIGTVLSKMNSGKYEIDYFTTDYILNDITCNGDNNIWIEGNGEKYFLVIKDTNVNVSGTITLNFSKKDHIGYQTYVDASNYFKVRADTASLLTLESEVFAISDMIIEAEDTYSVIYNNSDTIDENIYNVGDEIEVLDYEGKLPKNKEFLGWSLLEDAEEPDYLVGDIINIEDKDINLYPVFKDIEEEISEMESTEETTESSESIEESSETEESTMEETSSEEETTESEEISTENNSSEEAASTEEESFENTETIEDTKLEK